MTIAAVVVGVVVGVAATVVAAVARVAWHTSPFSSSAFVVGSKVRSLRVIVCQSELIREIYVVGKSLAMTTISPVARVVVGLTVVAWVPSIPSVATSIVSSPAMAKVLIIPIPLMGVGS